ncbi:MAG: peptidoglycan DD-metalloendopeptidase family protein [Chloroflexales bacterium]|nr:peptidoglycan DD-metalloendopeptidase family protein [Chloroflexales bacterium]
MQQHRRQLLIFILAALALVVAGLASFNRTATPLVTVLPPTTETSLPQATASDSSGGPDLVPTNMPVQNQIGPTAIGAAEPTAPSALPPSTLSPADDLFNAQRFSYEPDFYEPQIQSFLNSQRGTLKNVRFQVGDRSQSFAEVLVGMSSLYSMNPRIFLALLEQQSQLLSTEQPSAEQLSWAMGFQGEQGKRQGLFDQLRWAGRELRWAIRDYANQSVAPLPPLVFADGSRQAPLADISLSRYALARVLAPTTTPDQLSVKLDAFLQTYISLFDDPRLPPTDWPAPAMPFLFNPMEQPFPVTSFFDHDTPFLQQNGSLLTYWGRTETDSLGIGYDGHTGWDFAMRPPDVVLAAADGVVVFAGNSEDGCITPARAVIIEHGNGYRTLYWHLDTISVTLGQTIARGEQVGVAGETGCAIGPHLHFQVQYLGRDVDPYGWCGTNPDPWSVSPVGQVSVWLWVDFVNPCAEPPPGVIVVDETMPGFAKQGDWQETYLGYGGSSLFAPSIWGTVAEQPWRTRSLALPSVAIWRPDLPKAGLYRVMTYVPYALNGLEDSKDMRFRIRYSGGEAEVTVDSEALRNWWADLGTYQFDPAQNPLVVVSSLAGDEGRGVWADAIMWVPVEEANP